MSSRISLVVVWAFVLALILTSTLALALSTPFRNIDAIAGRLGFSRYTQVEGARRVKIAILDNGFRGHGKEIGKSLPRNTFYHPGPVDVDAETEESHGLFMAQIISGLLDRTPGIEYELHLYSAFGYSNFEAAVKNVIKRRVDVVLFSQVWEYGGNGDGHGFINALVSQATDTGLIWINAAGNFAGGTYQSNISASQDRWVKLPGPNDSVRVRCAPTASQKKCTLRAVLSWNDFKNDVREGTDKDLDLILTDDTLRMVASSGYRQMKTIPDDAAPIGASLYPREIVRAELEPGLYYLRAKMRSSNFNAKRDRLRFTISGENVQLVDVTAGETLLPPADHPDALTIGALDSDRSSTSAKMRKPELRAHSLVTLTNGEQYLGTSNSAAFAAATAVVLKALKPNLTRDQLIQSLGGNPSSGTAPGAGGQGLPLEILGFWPIAQGCFPAVALPFATPQVLLPLLRAGATVVQSNIGPKVFVEYDPFAEIGIERFSHDDMLVAGPRGFERMARMNQPYLAMNGMAEVVERPRGQRICPLSGGVHRPPQQPAPGGSLRLPPLASGY